MSVAQREVCPSPACPAFGCVVGSDEMHQRALAWRARPSVASARTWNGDDAYDAAERGAWLDLMEARGELLDIEICHGSR